MEATGRSEPKEEDSVPYLPEEIILHILASLPVESLLRFRSVSKQWFSWISETTTQLQKVIVPSITYSINSSEGLYSFQTVDQTSLIEDINIATGDLRSSSNGCPRDKVEEVYVYGSYNRFLLIRIGINLILWNPSTCSSKSMLPYSRLTSCPHKWIVPGLCFDSHNTAYKVVMALWENEDGDGFVVVGCFKSKSWKQLSMPYSDFELFDSGAVVNGRLHWLFSDNNLPSLVYFDPETDEFGHLPMPQPMEDQANDDDNENDVIEVISVGVLDGFLCMTLEKLDISSFDVLIMSQYGVKESWTVLFRFKTGEDICYAKPLFFTDEKKSEVLMNIASDSRDVIVAYDTTNEEYKDVVVLKREEPYEFVFVFEEMLVKPSCRTVSLASSICQETKNDGTVKCTEASTKKVWKVEESK